MSRDSVEGAIAHILWRTWEESLPNTPYQMALVIARQLRKEGYLPDGNQDDLTESLSPYLLRERGSDL